MVTMTAMSMTTIHAQEPSSAQIPALAARIITEDSPTLPAVEVKPDSQTAYLLLSVGTMQDLEEDAKHLSLPECYAVSQICL